MLKKRNKCKSCDGNDSTRELVRKMDDRTKPYTEEKLSDTIILRTFSPDVDKHLLKWHWDEEERFIMPLEPTDWRFQYENWLPLEIPTSGINIPKGVYHRIIAGTGELKLLINKS